MELMHNRFSKLEIKTNHPHSPSKEKEEEEEEVNRNWAELPEDVLNVIFVKLGTIDILVCAQWVCTSWWKLSKQPHLFRSIHVEEVSTIFGRELYSNMKLSRGMAREAIVRSCGQLEEFSVRSIANDGLLNYMSEKSSSLRCLRLLYCEDYYSVTDDGLIEIAKKLPQLEELEIIHSQFLKDVIETFGRSCPNLKSCRLNYVNLDEAEFVALAEFDGLALAIADNMPELRHLNLFGDDMTDNGLQAILDGCSHLESLDLRRCFCLNFRGDLQKRCKSIKVLRLPNDPTDDFEYALNDYNSSDGMNYDSDYYASDDYEYCASDDYPYARSL